MSDTPFSPRDGGTVTVAASTTSAHGAIGAGCHWIRVVNPTNGVAFFKTAKGSALTATAADFPVPSGRAAIMKVSPDHNRVAVILAAGASSGNVYVTPGTPKS